MLLQALTHTKLFVIEFCVVNLIFFFISDLAALNSLLSTFVMIIFFIRHNYCHLLKIMAKCKLSVSLSGAYPCPSR